MPKLFYLVPPNLQASASAMCSWLFNLIVFHSYHLVILKISDTECLVKADHSKGGRMGDQVARGYGR